uniref:N-acetyltransferase domain-containing protein n=1 Tax=Anopheles dirus TaxID=7168 RepID=A0A182MZ91_9DIPT
MPSVLICHSFVVHTMEATDRLCVIPPAEWTELRDLYRRNWPLHHVAYTTIDNYVRWYEKDSGIRNLTIYCLNGSWREDGTYLVVDRYQLFAYSLEPENRVLEKALHLLDWSGGLKVSSLLARHRQPVIDVITAKNLAKEYDSETYLYYMPKEECTALQLSVPAGFEMRALDPEDARKANDVWPNRHTGSLFFLQRLAAWNPNVGLYEQGSGKLVGWCFRLQAGPLGALQVDPDYMRRGFGTVVTIAVAKQIAALEISMDYLEKHHRAIESVISSRHLTVASANLANYYFLSKEQAIALRSLALPEGFQFAKLLLKDLDHIYRQWPLRDHISFGAGYGLLKRYRMAKYVIACMLVAVALFGLIQASDLILGTINSGDRVLYSQVASAPGIPGGLAYRAVNYTGVYNITAIRAYDRTFNRTGQAHVTGGGLYQRYVNLALQTRYVGNALDYLQRYHSTDSTTKTTGQESSHLCIMPPQATEAAYISLSELAELRDLYRVDWPSCAYTFYTLENFYNWRKVVRQDEVQVFTDPDRDWRSTGTFVLKDHKELFFGTLDATGTNGLEQTLERVLKCCDASVSLVYDSSYREMVDRVTRSVSYEINADQLLVCYRQPVPCEDADTGELQQRYRFRPVSPKESPYVEQQWVHSDSVLEKLPDRLINRNPSLGAYDTSGRLVAWCLVDQTGSLAVFQTIPNHRRRGVGRALIQRLAKQLHDANHLPQAFILQDNVASRCLFEKLGFVSVDLWCWTKLHNRRA